MSLEKIKKYAPEHYLSKLRKKCFDTWIVYLTQTIKQKNLKKKMWKKYRFALFKRAFRMLHAFHLQNLNKNKQKLISDKFRANFLIKRAVSGIKNYLSVNKKNILNKKIIIKKHFFFAQGRFFRLWNKKLKKIIYLDKLCKQIELSRKFALSKILFNDWIRRYNAHSYQRVQVQLKIHNFKRKWNIKKLAKCEKGWIRLYKNKENYRKMKKLSRQIFNHKTLQHYFVGFLIILEKSKIMKLKYTKGMKHYEYILKRKSTDSFIKFFNLSVRETIKKISSVKFWSKNIYQISINSWKIFINLLREKRELERLSWENRKNDLRKNGAKLIISFGLEEKSKRESYIRLLIIKNNKKNDFLARKYGKRWLQNVRNKNKIKEERYKKVTQTQHELIENERNLLRKKPRRLNENNQPNKINFVEDKKTENKACKDIYIEENKITYESSSNIEKRLEEIEEYFQEFQYEKQKLKELKQELELNPRNQYVSKLLSEQESLILEYIPEIKKMQIEIQSLKSL